MFGEILCELRKDRHLLQRDLAEILHVSVSTISNYETGAHYPDVATLLILSDYFHVSVDYLLGRSNLPVNYTNLSQKLAQDKALSQLLHQLLLLNAHEREAVADYVDLLVVRDAYHNPKISY